MRVGTRVCIDCESTHYFFLFLSLYRPCARGSGALPRCGTISSNVTRNTCHGRTARVADEVYTQVLLYHTFIYRWANYFYTRQKRKNTRGANELLMQFIYIPHFYIIFECFTREQLKNKMILSFVDIKLRVYDFDGPINIWITIS